MPCEARSPGQHLYRHPFRRTCEPEGLAAVPCVATRLTQSFFNQTAIHIRGLGSTNLLAELPHVCKATDVCGNPGSANALSGLPAIVVVYYASARFVTGGGWINSPAGAYVPKPMLTGKASFGFVSKYAEGATAPTGETEFQFQVANFDFHDANYQWLVMARARPIQRNGRCQ